MREVMLEAAGVCTCNESVLIHPLGLCLFAVGITCIAVFLVGRF
jgi:hypothetical protein